MPKFHYRGRTGAGQIREGTVEAVSVSAAADEVFDRGITPIEVRPAAAGGGSLDAFIRQLSERAVTLDELVTFTRQFRALLRAGVPVVRALRGLGQNTANARLGRTLEEVAQGLESGQTLFDAMSRHPKTFPRLLLAMIRVGEESGQLEESLERMAASLDQERTTRERIKAALRYPTFVMIAIIAALVVINLFVIPPFADLFDGMGTDLPAMTALLIGFSEGFVEYWQWLFGGALVVGLGVRASIGTDEGRLRWDYLKLRLPGVGSIMRRALLARFARTFSMAVRSGVPLLQAMDSVAEATDNAHIARGIRDLRTGIERGEGLYQVAERSGLFTPLVLQMLAVGEETGQVADMMDQVAEFYEREVEEDLKKLSSYIEPFVIGFIGVLVLILALGIFMPMWQMGAAAM
ncbi:type II secretion system F family protein [Halorhodospira halophila]|uniref:Type II secretion system protein n=1 Tax=Halorhodospira halophila (strain DSM 244 / SL1) TaxID=349124 RepID=A1WTV7_HALHL|nr:type II secretion system F family protein [Halorhodospira halophila]ABM61119.1 type II secretion system protein [Halorhodospira halophila SL1]MBK1730160.1 MSHA biogenesis protein MshG [Halorhodospira halophila]